MYVCQGCRDAALVVMCEMSEVALAQLALPGLLDNQVSVSDSRTGGQDAIVCEEG